MAIRNLAVVGLGKLGAPIAVSFAQTGLLVRAYDLDEAKVRAIEDRRAPVQEPGLQEALDQGVHTLSASMDPDSLAGADACIFVAPTPSLRDGSFDNRFLLEAINSVAPGIARTGLPCIFIIASTVSPGSCEKVLWPEIRKHSDLIDLVYKPEFIALGSVMHDLANPDAVLMGCPSMEISLHVGDLYMRMERHESRIPSYHLMTSWLEAELAKISLNCAITAKISFANQVGLLAEKLGVDPATILNFVGSDSRIGKKCLRYGMPYGGPCFPRDNRMFARTAMNARTSPYIATATDAMNEIMFHSILQRIPDHGSCGILGLAYKAGTSITEESTGAKLRAELALRGKTTIHAHDPLAGDTIVHSAERLAQVLACDTVVVTIDAPEYRDLEFAPGTLLIDPMHVTKGVRTEKGEK